MRLVIDGLTTPTKPASLIALVFVGRGRHGTGGWPVPTIPHERWATAR